MTGARCAYGEPGESLYLVEIDGRDDEGTPYRAEQVVIGLRWSGTVPVAVRDHARRVATYYVASGPDRVAWWHVHPYRPASFGIPDANPVAATWQTYSGVVGSGVHA